MRPETASRRPRTDELYFTYADLESMPDDHRRYEIIGGELVVTPSPAPRHQHVVGNLYLRLRRHVDRRRLGTVFVAPRDAVLADIDVVEPDLLFIAAAHAARIGEKNIGGPPDLAVEVISKGTSRRDRKTKRELYEQHRVAHYCILDPLSRQLEENVLVGRRYVRRSELTGNATFRPALFPKLAIALGKIWPTI